MFVNLLLAIITLNYSHGFVLECEFGNEEWINLGIVFQCKVQGMQITSRNSITEVVGAPFRPIRDVKALDVQDQRCQFVPADVQTFFPNIEGLQVANSELKELENADMQQFPNLKQLFMSENELQSLENDVFEPCPNIEYVNLGHNNIMHMGTDIFAPLKNLQYCNFAGNSCLDTKMESPNAIQQFSKDIQRQCPPTPEMVKREKERKIPESLRTMAPMTSTTTTTTPTPELEDLKEELKKLKNKIAEHDQEIDEIKSKENPTSTPETQLPDFSSNSQYQPEQNVQPSTTNSFNSLPDVPGQNLMDILHIPTNYEQYPSYSNQAQGPVENNLPVPEMPHYPVPFRQNINPPTNIPGQCGPYGCLPPLPPNNQKSPPLENVPPPTSYPNANQFQSPYPYNPTSLETRLPFPLLQNEPEISEAPENVAPESQMSPSSPDPSADNPKSCGQYGCSLSMAPSEDMQNTTPSEKPSISNPEEPPDSPALHRNLDVESGLSGMFCYII